MVNIKTLWSQWNPNTNKMQETIKSDPFFTSTSLRVWISKLYCKKFSKEHLSSEGDAAKKRQHGNFMHHIIWQVSISQSESNTFEDKILIHYGPHWRFAENKYNNNTNTKMTTISCLFFPLKNNSSK